METLHTFGFPLLVGIIIGYLTRSWTARRDIVLACERAQAEQERADRAVDHVARRSGAPPISGPGRDDDEEYREAQEKLQVQMTEMVSTETGGEGRPEDDDENH